MHPAGELLSKRFNSFNPGFRFNFALQILVFQRPIRVWFSQVAIESDSPEENADPDNKVGVEDLRPLRLERRTNRLKAECSTN